MRNANLPEPDRPGSSVLYRGPLIRSLYTTRWEIVFESTRYIWVTVELSDDYRATGIASGQQVDRAGVIGGVHINPPGEPMDLTVRGNYRAVQFAVPVQLASTIAAEDHELEGSRVEYSAVLGKPDRRLARLLYRAATRPAEEDEQLLMREVVAHLLLHYSSAAPESICQQREGLSPARLRRVKDLVDASYSGGLTIEVMAREAGLSPFHFAREFKRATGESPWSYVTSRRLHQALRLLSQVDLPLQRIAQMVGFADASHLSHSMSAHMGCSPTQARQYLLPRAAGTF